MPVFSFHTIQAPTQGIYKEKGSQFIAFAYPVASEEHVKKKLDAIKKEYFDARHHCFAYVLGAEKTKYRAFDDGEPKHSAGDPILGQIRSKDLTNTLIIVVRYFGGVKLGVGGLIGAYKLAAEDALNKAVVINCDVMEMIELHYNYTATPEVMRLVKEFEITILTQEFKESCELKGEVKLKDHPRLLEKIQLLQALQHPIHSL
jgi:uncharacterized YigZ family protein